MYEGGGRYSSRGGGGGGGGSHRDHSRNRDYDHDEARYDRRDRDRGRRFDDRDRDGDYRRSRKDSPPAPLRNLNYDDDDNNDSNQDHRHQDGPGHHHDRRGADMAPGEHDDRHGSHRHRGSHRQEMAGFHGVPHFREGADHYDRQRAQSGQRGSTKTVTLNGLPEDATERDILFGLDYVTRSRHFSNDQVRIVRIQTDQDGYPFASVEFNRRSDAEHFLDDFSPEISFPLQQSRGVDSELVTVTIESATMQHHAPYSRESRRDEEGWECVNCGGYNFPHRSVCFKCKEERADDDHYAPSGPFLTGETDECPQQLPSQYVVIRGLDRSVSEEVLAKGVMKLFVENTSPPKEPAPTSTNKLKSTAPTNSTVGLGAKPGSLRRIFLMRDRQTNESWRYGFAEFATVEDAVAAVAKFRASPKFTISSKPVVVAFIHTGVFIPAAPTEHPEFTFSPIYNPVLRLKYWDDRAYPKIHVVTTDPVSDAPSPDKGSNDDPAKSASKGFKKWKKDKEVPSAVPKIAMIPQMQLWAKASAQLHGGQAKQDAPTSTTDGDSPAFATVGTAHEAEDTQPDGPFGKHATDQYLSYADWDSMSCVACGWKASTDQHIKEHGLPYTRTDLLIYHEGKAHQFYRDPKVKEKAAAALAVLGKEPRMIIRRSPRLKSESLPLYKSYADFDRLYCVLCKRKFERIETIWLHEQQSELHKRMLADPESRARAEEVFEKLGKKQQSCVPTAAFYHDWEAQLKQSQGAAYRDRALERRQAFNQPKKPSGQPPATKSAVGEKRKEPSSTEVDSKEQPAPKKNKGLDMLAKMGWTAGAGLGADGAGRTEAIATEVYAPGVGLGVEGGKLGDAHEEANRKTKGDMGSFVEKTKDKARERFEKMA